MKASYCDVCGTKLPRGVHGLCLECVLCEEPMGALMPDGTTLDQWDERLRTVGGIPLYKGRD